jgi:hypothetical protein
MTVLAGLLGLAAGACQSGEGDGGRSKVESQPSPGCAVLSELPFPPALDWLPGRAGFAVAASVEPSAVQLLDARGEAPVRAADVPTLVLPDDSDGDGVPEGAGGLSAPVIDDVIVASPELVQAGLGLVTTSGYEQVIWFHPERGELAAIEVDVDASFAQGDFRRLPLPGDPPVQRTAISTEACIKPFAPIDSTGLDYSVGVPPAAFCDPAVPGSFYARFTSGATLAASRLFVSMSNLGSSADPAAPRFLPGAVLVYDLDLSTAPPSVSPNPSTPFIETDHFNPTHVTRVEVGGAEWVLVTASGAIGIEADDPGTPEVEQGTLALGPGAVEVIDPETLEHLGSLPIGLGALTFDRLAVDPSGRVAVAGSALARELYAIDLTGLGEQPPDLAGAVVFDAAAPLGFPALPGGPSLASCAPLVGGIAWNDAGDRLFVSERCDGSLSEFAFALALGADGRVAPQSFRWLGTEPLVAPLRADTLGDQRDPGRLRIRAARPGIDYSGPDALFLSSQPDAQACALRIESL